MRILGEGTPRTSVEFSDVLPVPQQRSELGRETVPLQTVLQPQLGHSAPAVTVPALTIRTALAVLVQADELGGKEA